MMDHNEFDFVEDLISPLHNFMLEVDIDVKPDPEDKNNGRLILPEELYSAPPKWRQNEFEQMQAYNKAHGGQRANFAPPQRIGLWNWFMRKFLM